ncbi:MAG: RNA polymerase sigma factor, partial [bacterium]
MAKKRIDFGNLKEFPDEVLVEHVSKGNPEAYRILIDRYEVLVRSIIMRVIKNDKMAVEDACQETFLRALARITDLRERSCFRSWLCTIARNQALDSIKKSRQVYSLEIEHGDEILERLIPDDEPNPEDCHCRSEIVRIMRDILKEMPHMYREPIKLRFEDDLDYSDIADILGKPLGTVKSLIHRGKMLIKKEVTR